MLLSSLNGADVKNLFSIKDNNFWTERVINVWVDQYFPLRGCTLKRGYLLGLFKKKD